jgi:ribosomal protein L39E
VTRRLTRCDQSGNITQASAQPGHAAWNASAPGSSASSACDAARRIPHEHILRTRRRHPLQAQRRSARRSKLQQLRPQQRPRRLHLPLLKL